MFGVHQVFQLSQRVIVSDTGMWVHILVGVSSSFSSSSEFPATSLRFTILGEIFAHVSFLNPAMEVVTFRLCGWLGFEFGALSGASCWSFSPGSLVFSLPLYIVISPES